MKRTPSGAPPWLELCRVEHGFGQRHRLPDGRRPGRAALDRQPRLHRSQSVVCDLRRRKPAGLSAFRSRPGQGFEARRDEFDVVREAALELKLALDDLKFPSYAKTSGSSGIHVYVPIERGPSPKGGVAFRQSARVRGRRAPPRHPHRRIQDRKTAARPRPGRLQSERLGPHAGFGLFGAPDPARHRVDAGDVGRDRAGRRIDDFRVDNVRERFARTGDLWAPLLRKTKRVKLERFLS